MLKNNKWKILISSLIILLPILAGLLLWNRLPDTMVTHWGADGAPDGTMGKALAIFLLPLILLALHLVCLFFTSLDKKQADQNKKALGIVFWIIPCISLFVNGMFYSIALGHDMGLYSWIPALLGILLLFMGNYLPKVKQNSTLGIKIFWTLYNEENWNKTHRFAGKVWVVCGLVMLLSAFLPIGWTVAVMLLTILVVIVLPYVYSYRLYRAHKKAGISYNRPPKSKKEKIAYW